MTSETIPEPGPARDRMVAEVVGWEWFEYLDGGVGGWVELDRKPSTSPADALAALEAWRAEHPWRFWEIGSPLVGDPDCRTWNVVLYQSVESDEGAWSGEGPTLPAAATAALLATREGT